MHPGLPHTDGIIDNIVPSFWILGHRHGVGLHYSYIPGTTALPVFTFSKFFYIALDFSRTTTVKQSISFLTGRVLCLYKHSPDLHSRLQLGHFFLVPRVTEQA